MNHFRTSYDSLPDEAKDAIMANLPQAMMWRGWAASSNAIMSGGMLRHVEEIARIFDEHGHAIGEYT